MNADELTEMAINFFGEGCVSVINEFTALYDQLPHEQQQVMMRFMDMLGTGMKVAAVDAVVKYAEDADATLKTGMDAMTDRAVEHHRLYAEGYAISVAKAFLKRGISQADVSTLLTTFDTDAWEYVKKGVLLPTD